MTTADRGDAAMEEKLRFFKQKGYYVQHGALSQQVCVRARARLSLSLTECNVVGRRSTPCSRHSKPTGPVGAATRSCCSRLRQLTRSSTIHPCVLHSAERFSCAALSPVLEPRTAWAADQCAYWLAQVYPFAQRVLGAGARLSGLTYAPRAPNTKLDPPADHNEGDALCLQRHWHREDSGNVEGAARNEFFAPALQVFFYLDDVDEQSHCTSVIPESADTKRSREPPSLPLQ